MKIVVRLAIVVAALLLVSNMAFTPGAYGAPTTCTGDQMFCYAVTETADVASPAHPTYKFCLNDNGTGTLCSLGSVCFPLIMFGGGPSWFNFEGDPASSGKPNWSALMVYSNTPPYNFAGYYQPLGPNLMLSGLEDWGGTRVIVTGIIIKCP
jgi:hypothetical protein